MCFGDMKPVKQTSTNQDSTSKNTLNLPDWVTGAGQDNYNLAKQIMEKGFQPYTSPRVAPLSANEQTASGLIANTAATGNPYNDEALELLRQYGNTPGFNFDFNTIVDQSGPLGSIGNYMSPYLQQVLDPTLREIALAGSKQRQGINANATQAGAFGDARHGVVESEQRRTEGQLVGDVSGKAFADAWADAMGRRTTDASRLLQTDQLQAGENAKTLDRARTSGIDLTNLDKYDVSRALGLASALGTTGETERRVQQAGLDADYQEFMRQQGFDPAMVEMLTKILGATPYERTMTGETSTTGLSTTSQPNNSGWQAIGSLAGALFSPLTSGISSLFGGSGSGNPNIPNAGFDAFGNPFGNFGF